MKKEDLISMRDFFQEVFSFLIDLEDQIRFKGINQFFRNNFKIKKTRITKKVGFEILYQHCRDLEDLDLFVDIPKEYFTHDAGNLKHLTVRNDFIYHNFQIPYHICGPGQVLELESLRLIGLNPKLRFDQIKPIRAKKIIIENQDSLSLHDLVEIHADEIYLKNSFLLLSDRIFMVSKSKRNLFLINCNIFYTDTSKVITKIVVGSTITKDMEDLCEKCGFNIVSKNDW